MPNDNTTNCIEENLALVATLDKFINATNNMIQYAKDNPFLSLIPADPGIEILETIEAYCTSCTNYINQKSVIPENTQIIFLELYNTCRNINDLFGLYFDEIRRYHIEDRKNTKNNGEIISDRQLRKLVNRTMISICDSLEPTSANHARLHGFYGQQCPNCKGYRTKIVNENDETVHCVKCKDLKNCGSIPREYFVTCRHCRLIYENTDTIEKCPHCNNTLAIQF